MSICHKNNSSLTSKLVNGKQILKAAEEIVAFKKNKYYSKDNIRVLKRNLYTSIIKKAMTAVSQHHTLQDKGMTSSGQTF